MAAMKNFPAPWRQADRAANPKSLVRIRPIATPSPSRLGLNRKSDQAAGEAASDLLTYNHETFHVFFNTKGFHNHLSHHVLAALSIGAPASHLAPVYQHALQTLDPKFEYNRKPEEGEVDRIEKDNWTKHVGKHTHYWPYLQFFEEEVERLGRSKAVQQYVFSEEAKAADMIARFVGGVLHPLIHTGYGIEFELDGLVAEGLAMTALTEKRFAPLLRTSNKRRNGFASAEAGGLSLFGVLEAMAADSALAPGTAAKHSSDNKVGNVTTSSTSRDRINHHVDAWSLSEKDGDKWEAKFEELAWLNTLLIGATSRPGYKLRHNFFLIHTLNGLLFLRVLLPLLSPLERVSLLDAYLRVTLTYWISNGRPAFEIKDRLAATTTKETAVGDNDLQNWSHLLDSSSSHLDEHYVKAMRTLYWLSGEFSNHKGGFDGVESAKLFRGLDKLDGKAFLKTAIQLDQAHGAARDGDVDWDFDGVGFDESYACASVERR